jgi:hypothetical protein
MLILISLISFATVLTIEAGFIGAWNCFMFEYGALVFLLSESLT